MACYIKSYRQSRPIGFARTNRHLPAVREAAKAGETLPRGLTQAGDASGRLRALLACSTIRCFTQLAWRLSEKGLREGDSPRFAPSQIRNYGGAKSGQSPAL